MQLKKLTPEQEAMIPAIRDEWLEHGLNCEPADWDSAEEGIIKAYESADLPPPHKFHHVGSPKAGYEMAKQFIKNNEDPINYVCYGQHSASWLGFYDCFLRFGVEEVKKLEGLMQVGKSAGWFWPFENDVIICDRPSELHRNEQDRLHNDSGPANARS